MAGLSVICKNYNTRCERAFLRAFVIQKFFHLHNAHAHTTREIKKHARQFGARVFMFCVKNYWGQSNGGLDAADTFALAVFRLRDQTI